MALFPVWLGILTFSMNRMDYPFLFKRSAVVEMPKRRALRYFAAAPEQSGLGDFGNISKRCARSRRAEQVGLLGFCGPLRPGGFRGRRFLDRRRFGRFPFFPFHRFC